MFGLLFNPVELLFLLSQFSISWLKVSHRIVFHENFLCIFLQGDFLLVKWLLISSRSRPLIKCFSFQILIRLGGIWIVEIILVCKKISFSWSSVNLPIKLWSSDEGLLSSSRSIRDKWFHNVTLRRKDLSATSSSRNQWKWNIAIDRETVWKSSVPYLILCVSLWKHCNRIILAVLWPQTKYKLHFTLNCCFRTLFFRAV